MYPTTILRPALRGALIGSALAAAFSLLGVIPVCGFAALPLRLVAWTLAGFLAARMSLPLPRPGPGIVAGLVAGIITGLADGVVNVALAPVRFKLAGDTMTSLLLLPQGLVRSLAEAGIDLMALNTLGGSVFFAVLLCGVVWLAAGVMAALGAGFAIALSE